MLFCRLSRSLQLIPQVRCISSSNIHPVSLLRQHNCRTQLKSSSNNIPIDHSTSINSQKNKLSTVKPLYSDPHLQRDRSSLLQSSYDQLLNIASSNQSKFTVFLGSHGVFYYNSTSTSTSNKIQPKFWSFEDVSHVFGNDVIPDLISEYYSKEDVPLQESSSKNDLLVWVGKRDDINYFAVYIQDESKHNQDISTIIHTITRTTSNDQENIKIAPLREFGDSLTSFQQAAILSTSNGLLEFHKSHSFCSSCGSNTTPAKLGASRICSSNNCKPVYPRIDVAAIMMITSPCGDYALLGRKKFWPKGRYSTLAGFTEVGETLEESLVRETYEESGVKVDPNSLQFIASQPWPFPRSLMVGFQARALSDSTTTSLPSIHVDEVEMESVLWFHRDYVKARLEGGSTAMGYKPKEEEEEFHIPGRASLSRVLITQWALG